MKRNSSEQEEIDSPIKQSRTQEPEPEPDPASSPSLSSSAIAFQTWEIENSIVPIEEDDPNVSGDTIFFYDQAAHSDILRKRPWENDPHYFKRVKISAVALLKMVVHARSGGNIEIMGVMQGKVNGDAIIVMDAFVLPVEGTETRVNAQAEAYGYMVEYATMGKQVGRLENVVGWYHSHPGYGCWLSGIDVSTQMLNQKWQEPFLAVVIDPKRTVSAGKVDIGAFRTYPEGYCPPHKSTSEYQSVPRDKIEDFGVHCKQYYSLDITYFKSHLDAHILKLLWNKYWMNTLSSSPLLENKDYTARLISDLAEKIAHVKLPEYDPGSVAPSYSRKKKESDVAKVARESSKIAVEQIHGQMSQAMKNFLFNSFVPTDESKAETSDPPRESMNKS